MTTIYGEKDKSFCLLWFRCGCNPLKFTRDICFACVFPWECTSERKKGNFSQPSSLYIDYVKFLKEWCIILSMGSYVFFYLVDLFIFLIFCKLVFLTCVSLYVCFSIKRKKENQLKCKYGRNWKEEKEILIFPEASWFDNILSRLSFGPFHLRFHLSFLYCCIPRCMWVCKTFSSRWNKNYWYWVSERELVFKFQSLTPLGWISAWSGEMFFFSICVLSCWLDRMRHLLM